MAQLPYQVRYVLDPRQGPQGQLPYIVDQDRTIGDATFIIEYLKHRYGDSLDARLTREQMHQLAALERVLDGSLMWVIIYSRWIDLGGWPELERELATQLPTEIRHVIPRLLRARVRRRLQERGFGELSASDVYILGARNLETLAHSLGHQPFFLGTEPTSIDAVAFSVLASILYVPIESELKRKMQGHRNLQDYCQRFITRYYSDSLQTDTLKRVANGHI
jgi:glutathione S-transferase